MKGSTYVLRDRDGHYLRSVTPECVKTTPDPTKAQHFEEIIAFTECRWARLAALGFTPVRYYDAIGVIFSTGRGR